MDKILNKFYKVVQVQKAVVGTKNLSFVAVFL